LAAPHPLAVAGIAITSETGGRLQGPGFASAGVVLEVTDDLGLPITHGQTGQVEIEVERASPMALALRAAGVRLGRRADR
jgi:hypothetical protein